LSSREAGASSGEATTRPAVRRSRQIGDTVAGLTEAEVQPMITREAIEQLTHFDGGGARVLSAYLDLKPERQLRRAYKVAFKDLVKEAREGLDKGEQKHLSREANRIATWLDAQPPRGRGLAVFACEPGALWQAFSLPSAVRDTIAFEPTPHVAPLLDIVDEYERYAVAVVDKEHARLFSVALGEIEKVENFTDFVPGKHDQGGPAQARLQRHHETHVLWHVKHVVKQLTELLRDKQFDRLIIAGPEEATTDLRDQLTQELASRVVAVVNAELFASDAEILEMSLGIERRIEREAEAALVDELIEVAAGHGFAVCGLAPTIEAVAMGIVHTLVIADDLRARGGQCPNCRWLVTGNISTCPACGHAIRSDDDVVDLAILRAFEQHARVEVVHDDAARRLASTCHGIGGVTRIRQG
jgi:peptide chain release factor subunit 1